MIGAIVPAAGGSSRFGSPKLLQRINGTSLVRHVVDRLSLAGVSEIVVVTGERSQEIENELRGTSARIERHDRWSEGLGSSIRCGEDALSNECQAILVALADQPFIERATIHGIVETWRGSNAAAVVPVYQGGVQGHPVLFDASLRGKLRELGGDRGARKVLDELGDRLLVFSVDAPLPRDVDTPADLEEMTR